MCWRSDTASGAVGSSLLYLAAYTLATPGPAPALFTSALFKWLGDYAGIVAFAPLVALLMLPRPPVLPARSPAWVDAALFVLMLAMVIALVLAMPAPTGERLLYLLFVPMIVLAMRQGYAGAALAVAVVELTIMLAMWLSERSAGR